MNLVEFEDDWRNMGQMEYLFKKTFEFKKYTGLNARDHEHCQFCWETFSNCSDTLHEGYCTTDENEYWVCPNCFNDFKEIFEWG